MEKPPPLIIWKANPSSSRPYPYVYQEVRFHTLETHFSFKYLTIAFAHNANSVCQGILDA